MSVEPDLLLQVLANTTAKWAVYVTAAIGFGVLYRALRVFHVSYAAIIGATPYVAGTAIHFGVPPALAVVLAFAAMLGATTLTEIAIFGPLSRRGASAEGGMIASLGVYTVALSLVGYFFGFSQMRLGLSPQGGWTWGGVVFAQSQALAIAFGLAAVALLATLESLDLGTRLRALGDNPRLLALYGQRVSAIRISAWCYATLFAAAGGLIFSADIGVDTRSGMQLFLAAAVIVFLGGVERPIGWIAAALVVATAENVAPLFLESKWSSTVVYGVALVLLIIRPRGLAGIKLRSGRAYV